MLLLQDGLPPVVLGPWGTLILTFLVCCFAFFTWRSRAWKETAAAAQENLSIAKDTIASLRADKEELVKKCAGLELKTDLQPLERTVKSWIDESRDRFTKAMQELAEIHKSNSANLAVLIEEVRTQRSISESSFKSISDAFTRHMDDDRITHDQEREERYGQIERILGIITNLEKRTAATDVALGYINSGKASRYPAHREPAPE
jgi:hypothetical protein